MEELDKMKIMWAELNNRISVLEEDNRILARKIVNQNLKTSQEKLVNKYTAFIILSLIMAFYMPVFVLLNPLLVEKFKVVTVVYWSVFFLIEAGIDIYLRFQVSKIDIYNSSVREIALQAANNWKLHKLAIFIGLPFAFGAIVLFGLLLDADIFVILCMFMGAVIGGLIGLKQLKKFYEDYRFLQTSEQE